MSGKSRRAVHGIVTTYTSDQRYPSPDSDCPFTYPNSSQPMLDLARRLAPNWSGVGVPLAEWDYQPLVVLGYPAFWQPSPWPSVGLASGRFFPCGYHILPGGC